MPSWAAPRGVVGVITKRFAVATRPLRRRDDPHHESVLRLRLLPDRAPAVELGVPGRQVHQGGAAAIKKAAQGMQCECRSCAPGDHFNSNPCCREIIDASDARARYDTQVRAKVWEEAAKESVCVASQLPGESNCTDEDDQPCCCCMNAARFRGKADAARKDWREA